MKGFVLAHRHPARRHALGERLALLIGHRDHGRFQGGLEGVLRAVARTDEGRQSAELQEFTHQPSSARRPQRHREVRRQDQPMQPRHPLRGARERRQGRRRIPARGTLAPRLQGAAWHTQIGGHAALRLPRRPPRLGDRDVLGLLQARAARHDPIPQAGSRMPGSRRARAWSTVNLGRTFEHLSEPSVSLHFQE